MSCPYRDKTDFYEDYLQQRITPEEREAFEEHLPSCPACRQELAFQRMIVAGLQEVGREEMKEEIRRQVAELEKGGRGDWVIFMKIAAAVLFFVIAPGMIYYYQHVSPPKTVSPAAQGAMKEELIRDEEKRKDLQVPHPDAEVSDELRTESPEKKGTEPPAPVVRPLESTLPDRSKTGVSGRQESAVPGEDLVNRRVQAETTPLLLEEQEAAAPSDLAKSVVKAASPPPDQGTLTFFHFDSTTLFQPASSSGMSTIAEISSSNEKPLSDQIWRFSSDRQTLTILLQYARTEPAGGERPPWPPDFPVKVIGRDSLHTSLQWEVPRSFRELDAAHIRLSLRDEKTLRFEIDAGNIYLINLTDVAPRARLIR